MASQSAAADDVYVLESVVCGHHVYKRIWTPHVGEQLRLKHEENNENDRRAVAVLKDSIVVGDFSTALLTSTVTPIGSPASTAVGSLLTGLRYRRRLIIQLAITA